MRKDIKDLIDKFDDEQKTLAKEVIKSTDRFIVNYSILYISLIDEIIAMTKEDIEEFHETDYMNLNTADLILALVINTLSHKTDRDIKKEFNDEIVLDKNESELTYLINLVNQL